MQRFRVSSASSSKVGMRMDKEKVWLVEAVGRDAFGNWLRVYTEHQCKNIIAAWDFIQKINPGGVFTFVCIREGVKDERGQGLLEQNQMVRRAD